MFKVWNGQLPIAIGGSHMLLWRFFAVFIVTRAESYCFFYFYGCWAGGQLVRLQPRNAPYVYGTVNWMLIHVFQTFISRFVCYSYLSRRYSGVRCFVSWAVWRYYLYLSRRFSDVFRRNLCFSIYRSWPKKKLKFAASDTVWRKYLDGGRRNR